jgi:hypothetical protein
MWTWAHWTAKTVMLAAAFAAAGAALPGAAFARTGEAGGSTSGSGSVLGGNRVSIPVSVPVNVCGNAAAVLGDSAAGCEGTAAVHHAGVPAALPEGMLPGSPRTVPMRRLSTIQPAADSLIPGLATLPVMSAIGGLPSQAASTGSTGPAWPPALPGGVYVPWASRVPSTGHLPLGMLQETAGRGAAAGQQAGNATVTRSVFGRAASRGLAALGTLPAVTGTSSLINGAAPAALSALTTGSAAGGKTMPASVLTVGSAPGMSAASFYSLAIGTLMAGAVALKMAGRRIRGRKA